VSIETRPILILILDGKQIAPVIQNTVKTIANKYKIVDRDFRIRFFIVYLVMYGTNV